MTPRQTSDLKWFVPETLIYGLLAGLFCWAAFRLLGHPLELLFHHHRIGYACLALGLMVFQGFALERLTHALITLVRERDPSRIRGHKRGGK